MKPVIIISVLLINASLAHADLNQDCTQFWTEIRHANDQFEEHKNLKSGEKLLALLPSEKVHPPADCAKKPETLEALYRDHAFRNKLMNSGKDLGFKLTLRMMHSADGAFSEDLAFELANSLQTHATQFLKAWKDEKNDSYCPKEIMRAVGTSADLSDKQRKAIFAKRAAGIRKVKDESLSGLKADCLKALQSNH